MSTKNTPRTDAATKTTGWFTGEPVVVADFARQLETELQTMTALAERLAEVIATCSVKDWFKARDSDEVVVTLSADKIRKALAAYENHKTKTP